MVFWTFPSTVRNSSFYFPDRTLVYNYVNDSWAINDDSFTAFGYFYDILKTTGATWGNTITPWQDITEPWNALGDALNNVAVKVILGGNQEGFVVILQPEVTTNASMLQVTNFVQSSTFGLATVTCINHNLSSGDYIQFSNMNGITFTTQTDDITPVSYTLTSPIGYVANDPYAANTPNSFQVIFYNNLENKLPVIITGTYLGGGTMSTVSEINILTKQYNFYTDQDRNVAVPKVDFLVDATQNGEVTVDFLISSSSNPMVNQSLVTEALLGDNVLETFPYNPELAPFEQYQSRLWHPVYFAAEGSCIQFSITMSDDQLQGYSIDSIVDGVGIVSYIANNDFQLNAMVVYAQPTSDRMQ